MLGNVWDAIAAITGVLTLLLSIALEWKRLVELFNSVRASSITTMEAVRQALMAVAKRALRPLLVILSIFVLVTWIRGNILIQPLKAISTWTPWQYAFAIAQIVPLVLLVYILFVEPWYHARRAERSRILFAKSAIEAINQIPVVPIVFYDPTFKCSWVSLPDKVCSYFEARSFLRANASELVSMIENAITHGTAHKTIFVFIHDVVPASITQVRDPSCTLGRYLGAGGRVVWWGDIPLHWRGWPNQMWEQWAGGPAILSVDHYSPLVSDPQSGTLINALWERHDLDSRIRLTDAGRAVGMNFMGQCKRPAGVDQNTIVYSEITGDLGLGKDFEALRWAISWRKVFNTAYPHSGFMQYPSGVTDFSDESIVEDFFRFSVSDWPFAFAK